MNNIEIYNYNNYELNIKYDILKDLTYLKVLVEVFFIDCKNIKKNHLKKSIDIFIKDIKIRIKSFQEHKRYVEYYSNFLEKSINLMIKKILDSD